MRLQMDRETLILFIDKYKSHSCLWDVANPHYMNRKKRLRAHEDLAAIMGEGGSVEAARKKIDVLRNTYLRELKKIKASTSAGSASDDVYTPSLWYFESLSFLSSCKAARSRLDNIGDSEVEEDSTDHNTLTHTLPIQRKNQEEINTQDELVNVPKKQLHARNSDNNYAFGLYLNQQLEDVDIEQRFLAEKLMTDILYLARKKYLDDCTSIVTRTRSHDFSTSRGSTSHRHSFITSLKTDDSQDSYQEIIKQQQQAVSTSSICSSSCSAPSIFEPEAGARIISESFDNNSVSDYINTHYSQQTEDPLDDDYPSSRSNLNSSRSQNKQTKVYQIKIKKR